MSEPRVARRREAVKQPSPRRGRPVSQEKQQAVLEAAIAEFAASGYDAASMDTIAAKAGVSKRTLYNRFDSKDGLFAALVMELAQRIVVSSTIEYDAAVPLRDQLMDYAYESEALMAEPENVQLLRAVLGEHIRRPERVEPLLHHYWVTEYGFIAWMKAAVADRRLQGDPTVMAHLMGAVMKSVVFWPTLLGRSSPADPGARRMLAAGIDMFLGHFASEERRVARAGKAR
jgi:TetR/AcrR family transcriptional regulator, regulator of autoinduction and epiphytic fitness